MIAHFTRHCQSWRVTASRGHLSRSYVLGASSAPSNTWSKNGPVALVAWSVAWSADRSQKVRWLWLAVSDAGPFYSASVGRTNLAFSTAAHHDSIYAGPGLTPLDYLCRGISEHLHRWEWMPEPDGRVLALFRAAPSSV